MRRWRTLLADDEPLARELLRHLLEAHADIEIVAEAADGATTADAILRQHPDLAFLDIRMPERNGFEVLASLPADLLPAVVFVTAFDRYALQAFEVAAVDYLLKPYDEERLAVALGRARLRLESTVHATEVEHLLALLARDRTAQRAERVFLDVGERSVVVPVAEIRWLEAAGKQVKVHTASAPLIARDSLLRLAELLDPAVFLRVSRSAIVNLAHVVEVHRWFHGDFLLLLDTGAKVPTTRGFRDGLLRALRG